MLGNAKDVPAEEDPGQRSDDTSMATTTTAIITVPNSILPSVPASRPQKAALPICQLVSSLCPAEISPR